jgi:phosphohistidine phosphatase
MRLILLRHAKSEKAPPGVRDRYRAINARGRKDAPKMGAYMAHHALIPDRVIVSSARRTRETWEQLAKALSANCTVQYEDRLYDAGPQGILAVIRDLGGQAGTLLVIGHNPGLHEAARMLVVAGDVEARERLNEGLPTSGVAVIDFSPSDWSRLDIHSGRLERFVTPRSLAAAVD